MVISMGPGHFPLDSSCQTMSATGNGPYDTISHHHYPTSPGQFTSPMNLSSGISAMHYSHYNQQTTPPGAADFTNPNAYMHPGYYNPTGVAVGSTVSAYGQNPYYYHHLGSNDAHHSHTNSYSDYDTPFASQSALHNSYSATADGYTSNVNSRTGYNLHHQRQHSAVAQNHGESYFLCSRQSDLDYNIR